jgi:hypothetical protein
LGWFCCISVLLHLFIGRVSPSLSMGGAPEKPHEIEIALEPLPEEKEEKPKPQPKPVPEKKAPPKPGGPKLARPETPKVKPVAKSVPEGPKHAPQPLVEAKEPRPVAPKVNPGGVNPKLVETPVPLGLPSAPKSPTPKPIRMARAAPRLKPEAEPTPMPATPDADPEAPRDKPTPKAPGTGLRIGLDRSALNIENPLSGAAAQPDEKPGFGGPAKSTPNAGGPRLSRTAQATPSLAGGGAPTPGPDPGRNGLKSPEAPPEDVLFNGGGAGGDKLPKAAPRIGGGGGRSLLAATNPLAKDAIPEDRPGLGPGIGGGTGVGAGGGVGASRGQGIGTSPDGKFALSTLRSKPGVGIGAGSGSGIGTRSPGGGTGTGAELPGTGGTGTGYGKGSGTGIGNGRGAGFAAGAPAGGGRGGGAGLGGGNGTPGRFALNRGIPFGDLSGLLTGGDERGGGGKGGGPGGPGRGGLFGQKPGLGGKGGDAGAPAHIVYLLDSSGSMNQGDKIGKAKDALRKALLELKPGDSFNIITFDANVHWFAASLLSASKENITMGLQYVEAIQLRGGTNLSAGLEKALAHADATHIFLLSDGEPSRGITEPTQLRNSVKEWNQHNVQILALALGLGEQFPGIPLLKGLADDNNGKFSYVNLAK